MLWGGKMAKSNIENQDVIIINNTYAGRYGQNKDNLPHEMINFFRADDDPNNEDNNPGFYIYITPSGLINNNIEMKHIKGIIFIRNAGNGMVEVLGKAEIGENSKFYTQGISSSKENQIAKVNGSKKDADIKLKKDELEEVCKQIKYGTKELSKIHEGDDGILVSMKVDEICLPEKTFYLTYKAENQGLLNDVYFLPANDGTSDGKKIANESMLAYYYKDDNANAYKVLLEDILKNNELWKDASETPICDTSKIDDEIKGNDNFFKITRQQDNEVMFSNMLFYYFSNYPDLLKYFVKNQFSIDLTDNYIVEREKERMDIRIIDDKHYIIIENKIKSSINGIKKKSNKKNDEENKPKVKFDYNDKGFAIDKEGKYISQLSDYLEKAEKAKGNRKIKAYILAPNYSSINKDLLGQKYSRGNEYEVFHYFDVKDKFSKYDGVKPPYYDDFLSALDKHTKKTDDEHRLDLLYRLKCRIDSIE